jgi:signal transduction histidine kinase
MTATSASDGAIPLRRGRVGLVELLQSIQTVMQPQAKTFDVTLTVEIDRRAPGTVFVDRHKIAWAITALVGNALRYVRHGTPRMPGGSIIVSAKPDADMDNVVVEIQDDGPGIPAETMRATNAGVDDPRAGLALAMIRDVVVAHGGRFSIRSRTDPTGHGTTVQLTLPAAHGATAAAGPDSTSAQAASPGS